MDDKMALYRECCLPISTKSWWEKLLSEVLGGKSPQSPLPLDPPLIDAAIIFTSIVYPVTSETSVR